MNEIERRRTFAIISHPDAGKTTLTEKFLLFGVVAYEERFGVAEMPGFVLVLSMGQGVVKQEFCPGLRRVNKWQLIGFKAHCRDKETAL